MPFTLVLLLAKARAPLPGSDYYPSCSFSLLVRNKSARLHPRTTYIYFYFNYFFSYDLQIIVSKFHCATTPIEHRTTQHV